MGWSSHHQSFFGNNDLVHPLATVQLATVQYVLLSFNWDCGVSLQTSFLCLHSTSEELVVKRTTIPSVPFDLWANRKGGEKTHT